MCTERKAVITRLLLRPFSSGNWNIPLTIRTTASFFFTQIVWWNSQDQFHHGASSFPAHSLRDFDNSKLQSFLLKHNLLFNPFPKTAVLSSVLTISKHGRHVADIRPYPCQWKLHFMLWHFFQKINFLWLVFSWGSARRWLYLQAVKLVPYNWLIKRLLIAEMWMMETQDMDTLALAFYTVLCSRGSMIQKLISSLRKAWLRRHFVDRGLNFYQDCQEFTRIATFFWAGIWMHTLNVLCLY